MFRSMLNLLQWRMLYFSIFVCYSTQVNSYIISDWIHLLLVVTKMEKVLGVFDNLISSEFSEALFIASTLKPNISSLKKLLARQSERFRLQFSLKCWPQDSDLEQKGYLPRYLGKRPRSYFCMQKWRHWLSSPINPHFLSKIKSLMRTYLMPAFEVEQMFLGKSWAYGRPPSS